MFKLAGGITQGVIESRTYVWWPTVVMGGIQDADSP
jgi:hypothetical protein